MSADMAGTNRGDCLAPTDFSLLANALDFIHEDHLRQREICAALDRIAHANDPDAGDIACVTGFLTDELPLHLEDEESDLFPLLKRRCTPEDEIGKAIGRVLVDHARAKAGAGRVIDVLEMLARGKARPSGDQSAALTAHAAAARRYLILENAIILPFARLRLTAQDLETLCLRMRARRGLTNTGENGC